MPSATCLGTTYIHSDRHQAEAGVVSNEWFVLSETMILDKTRSYDVYEIPVKESAKKSSMTATYAAMCVHGNILDKHNQDFRKSIPVFVDADESLIDWRTHMAWYKDAKHSYIDARDYDRSHNLEFRRSRSSFCDDGDAIDDDLHQKLYFKRVEDKDKEEESRPTTIVSERYQGFGLSDLREHDAVLT
jgi:hypothetical protein